MKNLENALKLIDALNSDITDYRYKMDRAQRTIDRQKVTIGGLHKVIDDKQSQILQTESEVERLKVGEPWLRGATTEHLLQKKIGELQAEIDRLKVVSGEDTAKMHSYGAEGLTGHAPFVTCDDPACQECAEIRERGQG